MTSDRTDGALGRPASSAGNLVHSLADLGVRITSTETLAMVSSAALSPAVVLGALEGARRAVAVGVGGVVLSHGGDTLEESMYLLDLHWDRLEPSC